MIRDLVYLIVIVVLLAAPSSDSQHHPRPGSGEVADPLRVRDLCPSQYTLGAPQAGVHVAVLPGAPQDTAGFYEEADEVFPGHALLPPVHVESLGDAWGLRADVYHDVLVLTNGPLIGPGNESVWGWACAYRAVVAHYPVGCPWRVALHELGHLLGYGHSDGGVMEGGRCGV